MSVTTDPLLTFRTADRNDCAHLVLFADMATRGLNGYLWGEKSAPGQPASEIGRDTICNNADHFTNFRNWCIAEQHGQIVGALNTYVIPENARLATPDMDALMPIFELKSLAVGSFYIASIAIYPEHQGKGLAKSILAEAEQLALRAGRARLTLLVASFNSRARRLYRQIGFEEVAERAFVPFPGSDTDGEWILMSKALKS